MPGVSITVLSSHRISAMLTELTGGLQIPKLPSGN